MWIAEEGLDAEGFVEPVVLGELVSVVEADSFAYRLWKFTELTSDGPGGEDSLSINRVLNDAEAGLSFVENQQPLAASGEQHEVGFPVAWDLAAFDLGGRLEVQAFAWGIVEALNVLLESGWRDGVEVGLAGQRAS